MTNRAAWTGSFPDVYCHPGRRYRDDLAALHHAPSGNLEVTHKEIAEYDFGSSIPEKAAVDSPEKARDDEAFFKRIKAQKERTAFTTSSATRSGHTSQPMITALSREDLSMLSLSFWMTGVFRKNDPLFPAQRL